jgi:hypothetical protein
MFEYICKKLGLNFLWKRDRSANFKATAKSKHEKAAATTGNCSPIQMSNGDIYNISNVASSALALDDHKSWNELLNCFSELVTEIIIKNYTKDPRIGKDLESVFGWKKYVEGKFSKIQIYKEDSRANAFINIKIQVIEALNLFMQSKNSEQFKLTWSSCREELSSLLLLGEEEFYSKIT